MHFPCRWMWCPGYYTSSLLVIFHIAQIEDEVIDPTGNINDKVQMTLVWHQKPRDQVVSVLTVKAVCYLQATDDMKCRVSFEPILH
jgi:hypothetical protein